MAKKIEYGRMLHGGDYNPEQWLDRPDILKKDIEYFKKAHINTVSVGIFSWAVLEPEEGKYNLGWLEEIIDNLYKEGISTILATPSGARPKWMADKYPEVLRMDPDRTRRFFGGRHNHCYTSPVYRQKVHDMDKLLSQRLGSHPGVILWHISNEFGGECYCPLCQQKFREWRRTFFISRSEKDGRKQDEKKDYMCNDDRIPGRPGNRSPRGDTADDRRGRKCGGKRGIRS